MPFFRMKKKTNTNNSLITGAWLEQNATTQSDQQNNFELDWNVEWVGIG